MKCPNCEEEIKDGYLYCENCGAEIHMVPDFEPEIEYSMHKALKKVVKDVSVESGKQETDTEEREPEKKKNRAGKWIAFGIVMGLIFAAALTGTILQYHYNSMDYQLEKAHICINEGNMEDARAYYERAIELNTKNMSVRLELAALYSKLGLDAEYLEQLQAVAASSYSSEEQVQKAYAKMIGFFEESGNYKIINELLSACTDEDVVNENRKYMAKSPEFSYQEGSYAEVIPLKLSADTAGTIYYTMDGTVPDENSEVYTTPIFLETGEYEIMAVFVNEYGVKSDVVVKKYHIDVIKPAAPEVQVYSGEYHSPTMIKAEAHGEGIVYYTTDGSVPTDQSTRYQGAIPMPLGKSRYKFIVCSEEGVYGDVTDREYELTLQTDYTPDMACRDILNAMLEKGRVYDLEGNSFEVEGKYKYLFRYALALPDEGDFYVIAEMYEDTAGNQTKTGSKYAANVYTGELYRLVSDEDENYLLQGF